MFVKLIVIACAVTLATAVWNGPLAGGAPADRYPAGVSPQACPNYPHCNNPAVAANPGASAGGWGAPQWNAGAQNQWNQGNQWNAGNQWNGGQNQWNDDGNQWNGGNDWNQNALDRGDYTGDGDYRGEGLAESGANSGYDGSQGYAHQAPAAYGPHNGAAQVPAGVDPSSCPNYPFCH